MKKFFIIFLLCTICDIPFAIAFADDTPTPSLSSSASQTPTPTTDNSQSIADLENQISELQNKISDTQAQEKTLSSAISVINNQIDLTKLQINSTQQQINQLTSDIGVAAKKITTLSQSLNNLSKLLLQRVVASYKIDSTEESQSLLASSNINDLMHRVSYMQFVQKHDQQLLFDTQQAQNDYANQKNILQTEQQKALALKASLASYSDQLNQQQQQKQALLTQTQGSEANYERLLAQAQAELAGFSSFTQSQGGASLLSNQTTCDSWGCYYNQRDSQWGNVALNHTEYSIASDGCLLTSVAMVMTHYGKHVTPLDIDANPNNFASYYPAYLLYTVTANGSTATRTSAAIDSTLASGNPVIVGIRYASGDTHFIVFVSGSNGNYVMDDPYIPNGHNINFTDHYSMGMIFEVDAVSVT